MKYLHLLYTESITQNQEEKSKFLSTMWDLRKTSRPNLIKIFKNFNNVQNQIKTQSLSFYDKSCIHLQKNSTYKKTLLHVSCEYSQVKDQLNLIKNEKDALDIVQNLIYCIAQLHELKIAHGDLWTHSVWISHTKHVKLSHFQAGYSEDIVESKNREILNNITVMRNLYQKCGNNPISHDMLSLIGLIYSIILRKNFDPDDINQRITRQNGLSTGISWLDFILRDAQNLVYTNASSLLFAFTQARPKPNITHHLHLGDTTKFHNKIDVEDVYPFILDKNNLLHSGTFKNIECNTFLFENTEVILFDVNFLKLEQYQHRTFHNLFKKFKRIQALNATYIAKVISFGYTEKHIYFVTEATPESTTLYDRIENIGTNKPRRLGLPFLTTDRRYEIAERLIEIIQNCHSDKFEHGALELRNIQVSDEYNVEINFPLESELPASGPLDPKDIVSPNGQQRDNHAVLKIIQTLFQKELALPEWSWLADAFEFEFTYDGPRYIELERFLGTFKKRGCEENTRQITIYTHHDFEGEIIPDNRKLYVRVGSKTPNTMQQPGGIPIEIGGLGGQIKLIYKQNLKSSSFIPHIKNSSYLRTHNITFTLDLAVNVIKSTRTDIRELIEELDHSPEFKEALLEKHDHANEFKTLDINNFVTISSEARKLWHLILETEDDAWLTIELKKLLPHTQSNKCRALYDSWKNRGLLKQFSSTDKDKITAVLIEEQEATGKQKKTEIGEIDLLSSVEGSIALRLHRGGELKSGSKIALQSQMTKSAFLKRKAAVDNILENKAQINNLVDYFNADCSIDPTYYPVEVSNVQLEKYQLNDTQQAAFKQVLKCGPVSALQGPPGTGKTEFIGAFVHFILTQLDVKNVLIVSQSHEAINTTAERVRDIFSKNEDTIEIVRLGSNEDHVSTGLLDTYSDSIIEAQKHLFESSLRQRLIDLSHIYQINIDYLNALLALKQNIFMPIKHIIMSDEVEISETDTKQRQFLHQKLAELNAQTSVLNQVTSDVSKIDTDAYWLEMERIAEQTVSYQYSIDDTTAAKAKALINIITDYKDLIDAPSANYERFLTQTKQLVCGTCVGIGKNNFDISNQSFDWVIVDEAGRSVSSELAIAMQSAQRILLVGDQEQLPPMYSEIHKKLIADRLQIDIDSTQFKGLLQSDFARLFESRYGERVNARLLTQYRMTPAIGNMISDCFYNSLLQTAVYEARFGDAPSDNMREVPDIYRIQGLSAAVTWVDTGGSYHEKASFGTSLYNSHEIDEIILFLSKLSENQYLVDNLAQISDGEPAIGIICMYAEQVSRIQARLLAETRFNDFFKKLIKVDTVDSYQGKQNRIIFLSITRNNNDPLPDFLLSHHRVNVALSRAMDRLVIFGASEMWSKRNVETPLGRVFHYIVARKFSSQYTMVNKRKGKAPYGR